MPKAKRKRGYNFTNVKKTGKRGLKVKIVEDIRECFENYNNVFVFRVHNMKNITLKKIRRHWTGSRFYLAKNKLMIIALGHSAQTELGKDLHRLTKRIRGEFCGLMFTDSSKEDVLKYFSNLRELHYARQGFRATKKITLPEGPLLNCPASMETRLRKLGLRTKLNVGVVELTEPTIVCEKNDPLSSQQCQILELFEILMAEFRVEILSMYKKSETGGVYEDIVPPEEESEEDGEDDTKEDDEDDEDDGDTKMKKRKLNKSSDSFLEGGENEKDEETDDMFD